VSDAYLVRLIQAAHDLAFFDASVRRLLGTVDWGTCETPEETDYETLSCLQQEKPDADPFSTTPICAACEVNRATLKQVKAMRRKRYLAMLRVVRLSAHVRQEAS
jgi:hypothetical protein